MNQYLFLVHKEKYSGIPKPKPLSFAELKSVLENHNITYDVVFQDDSYFCIQTEQVLPNLEEVLSLTHKVFEFIAPLDKEKLEAVNWMDYYKGDFGVHCDDKETVNMIAETVWDRVENPKVNLKDSKCLLYVLFDSVYVLRQDMLKAHNKRKSHMRPVSNSDSLDPSLAKALINLTSGKSVYDPFCGMGGFLIEAALMGREIHGSDLSYRMLKGCETNLKYYGIKDFNVRRKDATKIVMDEKVDAIVCDPPYGRASSLFGEKIDDLYIAFLKNVPNIMKKGGKIAMIFPSWSDWENIVKESGFEVLGTFKEYVHKKLTRHVVHMRYQ